MNAVVQSLRELSQAKLAALIGTGAALIGFFVYLSLHMSSPTMSPLYSSVDLKESGQIVAELEKQNVPYQLNMGGAQILVPAEKVEQMRVKLAAQGLPSSGSIGYEIFDHSDALGTSNFVLNINKLRALEGELGRTISTLSKVESARVHLVVPKRELFNRDQSQPTASVALQVRGAQKLEKQEIAAIQHLVATAVPDLKPGRITIVDQKGNLLARGGDDDNDPAAMASTAQEYRSNYENKLKNTIESLLEQSVGVGAVKAEVSADIDFDRVTSNSEKFDPEGQVVRSVQNTNEKDQSSEKDAKDTVSVGQNLPDASKGSAAGGNQSASSKNDETTNYEISKTVESHVKESGTVQKLSIAVLVDGTYTTDKDNHKVYAPRPDAQIQQIATLVKSAVGFDEKRGDKVDVINMPFAHTDDEVKESPLDFLKNDVSGIIQTLVVGGVAVLVILLIIRPLVSRAIMPGEKDVEDEDIQRALLGAPVQTARLPDFSGGNSGEEEEDNMITIDKVDGVIRSSVVRRVTELVDKHPEEALSVLRQWAGL